MPPLAHSNFLHLFPSGLFNFSLIIIIIIINRTCFPDVLS